MITGGPKKRPRATPTQQNGSCCAVIDCSFSDESLCVVSQKPRIGSSLCLDGSSATTTPSFNDPSTADVILRLFVDSASPLGSPFSSGSASVDPAASTSDLHLYLHSDILRRSKYFSVILSDRWNGQSRPQESDDLLKLNLEVPLDTGAIQSHFTVLELLYTNDFANTIDSASTALDLLPVALELLFEECVRWCVTFLEAVPWSEEEERRVLKWIPFLCEEESKELLARVSPVREDSCESMLEGLISSAIHNYQNTAYVKVFVTKILRDFSSRESVKRVLEKAFKTSLQTAKKCLEDYSSPDFRGDHNETEALQKLNLHKAMTHGRHLQWLLERMIELRVADQAVKEWSDQAAFSADLQRAFRDDACRNIYPGLPTVWLRCTHRLAKAVSVGAILAARQVRRKLVEEWLPVLVLCKDNVSSMSQNKALYVELEEIFLSIISTLPMSDAQKLLPQCLSFSTRNVEDCPHLVTAFNTWFRRAAQSMIPDDSKSYNCYEDMKGIRTRGWSILEPKSDEYFWILFGFEFCN